MQQLSLPQTNFLPISRQPNVQLEEVMDWQAELKAKTKLDQLGIFDDVEIEQPITLYRSGVSSRSDLNGVMQTHSPVCVCILETSVKVKSLLVDYGNRGNRILFDSGAFGAFKKSLKSNQQIIVDFKKVIAGYLCILKQIKVRNNLTFVAPDVVGKQSESLALFSQHLTACIKILNSGAHLMLPLQQGERSLAEVAQELISMLPAVYHSQVIFGLPSNAKAIKSSDVTNFIKTFKPHAIHFLGCSETSLAYKAKHLMPQIDVSCDANRIRKWVGKGKLLTEMHSSVLDEVIDHAWVGSTVTHLNIGNYDFTEFLGGLSDFVSSAPRLKVKRLAKLLGCSIIDLEVAEAEDQLVEYIDSLNYGYSDNYLYQFYESEMRREISPKVRQYSIATLATNGLI